MATQEEIKNKWEQAQRTSLWTRTLGSADAHVAPLRDSFLDARKNAEFLLNKIRNDFKNLTVHDITHVDSLWNVADTIIGKDYPINPLEGYILGIAFLIHDVALSYDAVGGEDKLRGTKEWKDAYADGPGEKDKEEFIKECDFDAIRAIHAKYAEDILDKTFERNNTTSFYIIDNDEYRIQFGHRIGKIAASHHWSIDKVESDLDTQINPIAEFPGDWEINEQKLACILRCADAGHIDNGRAPYGIYNSLIVNGVSRDHWESQTRLGQVRENKKNPEQLLITSTRPFEKNNFAAWNVAYDAVRIFDEELKKSNELLKPAGLSFPHVGVTGAESKEALYEYIKTNGWQPCSFGVHTSNVKGLIENLGGSKLYGEDNMLLVALRELIQNARDAIHARRMMDDRPEEGRITIRIKEEAGKRYVEVEDDGIGMSLDCIKNYFLDFGSSYWKSNSVRFDYPGLRSKGFKSIGKFGIGFYSVFMVAKSVEVVTKRYDKSVNDAKRIEFPEGLTLSPILSEANLSPSVSTKIKIELKDDVDLKYTIEEYDPAETTVSLHKALQLLLVGLDVDVYYYEDNNNSHKIHTNIKSSDFDKKEWLENLFIKDYPDNIEDLVSNLEFLKDETGEIRGLIVSPNCFPIYNADYPDKYHLVLEFPSILTIGGLMASIKYERNRYDCYIGYLDGKESSISRNYVIIDESLKKNMQRLIKEQYNKNFNDIINEQCLYWDNPFNHYLVESFNKYISFWELEEDMIKENTIRIYKTLRFDKKMMTLFGLLNIHLHLFAGIYNRAGGLNFVEKGPYGYDTNLFTIKYLEYLLDPEKDGSIDDKLCHIHYNDATNRDAIKSFIEIADDTRLDYITIIHKICVFLKNPIFNEDQNNLTVEIWGNLMLDMLDENMIDWIKVDDKYLRELINNNLNKTGSYLEQFLIPTNQYLDKIGAFSNENS